MAFTATLTTPLNITGTVISLTQAGCYFKIDGTTVNGGKDAGAWTAWVRCYANQAVRNNDLGDDYRPAAFWVSTPYVVNVDPYPALYTVAKAGYSDAVDVI
jgi:hypothetical protein